MFAIDHLVLPVPALSVARHRLEALGFTVAADAAHPFGTGNACVFLADGTYLEPLAVIDPRLYEAETVAGNSFVRQDLTFRRRYGQTGFSAIALATTDAAADHGRFMEMGVSGGSMLEFSRPVVLPDGGQRVARFRLAFARGDGDGGVSMFTCQRIDPLPAARDALSRHANGTVGLARVVVQGTAASRAYLSETMAMDAGSADRSGEGSENTASSGARPRLSVLGRAAFAKEFTDGGPERSGRETHADAAADNGGPTAAIVFRVADLAVTRAVLAANDVAFVHEGGRIRVAAAPAQGAVFAFEE